MFNFYFRNNKIVFWFKSVPYINSKIYQFSEKSVRDLFSQKRNCNFEYKIDSQVLNLKMLYKSWACESCFWYYLCKAENSWKYCQFILRYFMECNFISQTVVSHRWYFPWSKFHAYVMLFSFKSIHWKYDLHNTQEYRMKIKFRA